VHHVGFIILINQEAEEGKRKKIDLNTEIRAWVLMIRKI
jgi:hypothetical protein